MLNPQRILQTQDERLIMRLLAETKNISSFGQRAKILSSYLIGRPYLRNPLIGSPTQPETFVTRMDGFDCITLIETVLALADSRDTNEFIQRLREIRYTNGEVNYQKRLHYTTEWSRYHVRRRFLRDMTLGELTVERSKTLNFVKGIAPLPMHFRCYLSRHHEEVSRWLRDGDLIYFATAREGLDVSHASLLFRDGERVLMRHAARRQRAVIEQPLSEFFKATQTSGFIIARPNERESRSV